MKKVLLIALVALVAASCAPTQPTQYVFYTYDYNESTARNLEPEHIMLTTPMIADIEVSPKRITHVEKEAFADIELDEVTTSAAYIENFKKIALSKAAKANDADLLVGSMIDVQTVDDRLIITITGFPAKYVNFRKATVQDTDLIRRSYIFGGDNNNAMVNSAGESERITLYSDQNTIIK